MEKKIKVQSAKLKESLKSFVVTHQIAFVLGILFYVIYTNYAFLT